MVHWQKIKKNITKGFTLVEILFAVALTAAATVSIGSILVSTQNNTTKMFTQGELQQQTAEFQEDFRNQILQTNFGARFWFRDSENGEWQETLAHTGNAYEKLIAFYSFDRLDYQLVKTYYKFNSVKKTVEIAEMRTDMEAYKDYEDDIIIKVDFDIDRTISKIPNWTIKAANVSEMSIDLTKYKEHQLLEYYLQFDDDSEKYPTNDAVYLRSKIEINNDLVVSSQKHIEIPKPYISGEDIFLYDGYRKTPNIIWDSRLTLTTPDSIYGTDPGTYTVTFKLPNDESYMWDDGSEGSFSLQWHITSTAGENPNGIQAYAIYTASDKTLRFYKNADNPRENNQYQGRLVTKKFANIEEINATSPNGVPWRTLYYDKIEHVEIVDEIAPTNTAYWFYKLENCKSINGVEKLKMENVTSTRYMFAEIGSAVDNETQVELNLSGWDVAKVADMSYMYYNTFADSLTVIKTPQNVGQLDPAQGGGNWNVTMASITGTTWYSLTNGGTYAAGSMPKDYRSHYLTSIDPTASYTLRHWQQNINGNVDNKDSSNYTLAKTETHTAFAGMNIYPPVQTFTGFKETTEKDTAFVIQKDNSSVIDFYYPRQAYNVNVIAGHGIANVTGGGSYLYGATVNINASMKAGYKFSHWSGFETSNAQAYAFTMTECEREYTANTSLITYNISYDANGGTLTSGNPSTYNVETPNFVLKNPTKTGYVFAGWTGSNGSTKNTNLTIATGSTGDKSYTANWDPSTNTPYTVKHYTENLDGTYTLANTDTGYGTTDTSVTAARRTYTGFTSPAGISKTVLCDGSQVFEYYYTRNSYTVTLNKGTGIASVSGAGTYKYGASVTINSTLSTTHEYQWTNWTGHTTTTTQKYTFTMPASNVTFTANGTEIVSFAIYSATDNSLRFYRSTSVPAKNTTYNSRAVTAIYTRVNELQATATSGVPWLSSYATSIKTVSVEHTGIKPISTAYWFDGCTYMTSGTFTNLDMSKNKDMTRMFAGGGRMISTIKLTGLDGWNTSACTSMYGMFSAVGYYKTAQVTTTSVTIGNLSGWNTTNVTNMGAMFSDTACFSKFDVGNIGKWNTAKVTNMSFMFNACGKMVGSSVGANTWYVGDISNWNTAKVTTFAFMFNEAAKYNGSATVPLNLSKWNTGSATDMQYMFSFAWNAKSYTQNLSGWNVSKVTSYANFNAYIGSKVICPAFR